MIGNREIIEKADLSLADLAVAGVLQPEQARNFIRTLIDQSTVLPMARVIPMRNPTRLLEKIRFGTRILRAGTEGQALTLAERASPDLEKVELNSQLFKAEIRLNNEVLEDSIERNQLRQTVIAIMGEAIARDMDEILINGDTASGDPFLAKFDGIIKQAVSNVVAFGPAPVSKTVFRDSLKALPTEFMRNKRRMRFMTSVDAEIDYRDITNARETQLGDRYLESDVPIAYSGVPIIDVPLFPEALGVGTNETVSIFTDPKNIAVGIQRRITMETDKDISAGVLVIVATLRFDVKYVEERAVVKATGITVS